MKETESIQTVDTNIKIPFWKAACFGLGDFGNNFVWTFVGSYLMIFYTDVFGIPMAAVSLLMLIARAWDAINDPIIGGLSDRTRTRWGRYRPWVLLMSFPTAIITVLTFWAHPDWSNTSKIVYMYVTYALLVFCYTGVNIPYSAMTSVLTQNTDERAKLSTMRITLDISFHSDFQSMHVFIRIIRMNHMDNGRTVHHIVGHLLCPCLIF